MKTININEVLSLKEETLEITYKGKANDDIDESKIQKLLKDFIESRSHNDMFRNVVCIRTILKDCEEEFLKIYFQDKTGSSEFVTYINSLLFTYERTKKETKNSSQQFNIKYDIVNDTNISFDNYRLDISDYSKINPFSKEIEEIMKHIYFIGKAKKIVLDNEEKTLIEKYRLFYGENPDFTDKDINIKFQTMLCILSEFGLSNYSFETYKNLKMPKSLEVEVTVERLYPLGKIEDTKDSIKFNEISEKMIKIIGEAIRETANNDNLIETLITVSRIIHCSRYNLSSSHDTSKLSEHSNCTLDEVESSIQLVKRIENEIKKQTKNTDK